MHPLVYDVAVSLDGYIAGPGGDVSRFAHEGAVVDDYLSRLAEYAVALMGRETYEFGYRFGLAPGQNPYPHMRSVVISSQLSSGPGWAVEVWREIDASAIAALKVEGPVYLCGGGALAGSLAKMGVIDLLRVKEAPALLGGGVPLFGPSHAAPSLTCSDVRPYADGTVFREFSVSA